MRESFARNQPEPHLFAWPKRHFEAPMMTQSGLHEDLGQVERLPEAICHCMRRLIK